MSRRPVVPLNEDGTLTVRVPLAVRKRGGRKVVVVPGGGEWATHALQPTSAAVRALARAFRWRKLIETGTYSSVAEIASVERVNPSYAGRVLRLTLLSPETIQQLLEDGTALSLDTLLKQIPIAWHERRRPPG